MIRCPHCGDQSPEFDYAHVCSSGPYAPKLDNISTEDVLDVGLAVIEGIVDVLSSLGDD